MRYKFLPYILTILLAACFGMHHAFVSPFYDHLSKDQLLGATVITEITSIGLTLIALWILGSIGSTRVMMAFGILWKDKRKFYTTMTLCTLAGTLSLFLYITAQNTLESVMVAALINVSPLGLILVKEMVDLDGRDYEMGVGLFSSLYALGSLICKVVNSVSGFQLIVVLCHLLLAIPLIYLMPVSDFRTALESLEKWENVRIIGLVALIVPFFYFANHTIFSLSFKEEFKTGGYTEMFLFFSLFTGVATCCVALVGMIFFGSDLPHTTELLTIFAATSTSDRVFFVVGLFAVELGGLFLFHFLNLEKNPEDAYAMFLSHMAPVFSVIFLITGIYFFGLDQEFPGNAKVILVCCVGIAVTFVIWLLKRIAWKKARSFRE